MVATKVFQGAAAFTPGNSETMIMVSIGGRIFSVSPTENYTVREVTPTLTTTLATAQISPPPGTVGLSWLVTDDSHILIGLPVRIGDGSYQVTNKQNNLLILSVVDAVPGIALPVNTPVIALDVNSSIEPTAWFERVEGWVIIQDGQSPTIISDGFSSRRRTQDEVPVGTVMNYHRGRLWVAVNGNQIAVGDIVSTTDPASALKFTEENFATGGGRFRVGSEITAMVTMPSLDASLGQGPIQVITSEDFNSFNLPAERELWNTLTYAFQTISVKNFGGLGQYGVVVVNGDVFYRAKDGIRSFVMARRQFGRWGNVSISNEMSRITDSETQPLLKYSSMVLFDNRMLVTMQPKRLDFNAYFLSMGALDFDPITGISDQSPPVWEGIWTGIHPYQLLVGDFEGETRCFAFTNEPTGIGLWEITKDADFDGDGGRIFSWVEYPVMRFADPFGLKKLQSTKIFVADIVGSVDFVLRFRNDDAACWIPWGCGKTLCAKVNSCKSGDCYTLQTFKAGYKPHMGFGQPPDACEAYAHKNARFAYQWQHRLEWTGHATIKRVLATADNNADQVLGQEDQDDD